MRAHVVAAERLHADDTTMPVLDVGRTGTGRLWTYVRDDRPFAGADPLAAACFYSPDRRGEHPEEHLASWAGRMQADACVGYNRLYEAGWLGEQHAKLSSSNQVAKAIAYSLNAWDALVRFLDDGRL